MSDGLLFLIDTLFSLFVMALIVRLWMQLVRANASSGLAEGIRKVTNPLVNPLQRVLPTLGRFDLAVFAVAFIVTALKFYILVTLRGFQADFATLALVSLISLAKETLTLLFWVLIIRAILSWFSQGRNPLEYVLYELTEPLLRPIRSVIPPLGGLDLSVLILIILIQFLLRVIA